MPVIIAMWHGQHFLMPFVKTQGRQSSRQGADLAPPRRRDQCARRREARHRHHPRLRRAQRRIQPQGRRRRLHRNARGARARLQYRAHRRRAEGRARRRARHRQAGAAFRPADLRGGDGDAAAASSSTIGIAARSICRSAASALVASEPIYVPRDADDAALEAARREVENELNAADRARLRNRRPARGARSRERQAAGTVARLPAVFGGDDAVDAAVAGAAAAARQGASPARCPSGAASACMARPPGPLVWLHGASVGELISVLPLIERIRAREVNVLVTSGTVTSGGLAEQRLPRGVIHQFVPLDVPLFVRRFLDHWQPDLALFVESDLWPNIMIETSRRGVPMILVNGRLSENSFRRWRYAAGDDRQPAAAARSLPGAHAGRRRAAQRTGRPARRHHRRSQARRAGAARRPAPSSRRCKSAIGGRPLIAAASTHAGEETAMIEAHRRLRANFPGLLTLIVPRHPERGAGVAEIARAAGLKVALALARRTARRGDRHLCRRHGRRTRPHLSPGADRVRRRLAGRARRAESDRARQARRRHPAWPACLEFRRNLRRARPGAWRRAGRRRRQAHRRLRRLAGATGSARPRRRRRARDGGTA